MSSTAVWIVGAGGQLGRELSHGIRVGGQWSLYEPAAMEWRRPGLQARLASAIEGFVAFARPQSRWLLCWTAGAGVVGTAQEDLAAETAALAQLLEGVAGGLPCERGAAFVASSAGGVYGESAERPLDEASLVAPISDYGRNKLAQEELATRLAATHGLPLLLGRISNLYGPHQDLQKAQGFISQSIRSLLLGSLLNIYVSLDTQRDFLFTADCAAHVQLCLERLLLERPTNVIVKVFANGQSATLRQVLGLAQRLSKKKLRVGSQPQSISKLQPRSHHYRSRVWSDLLMPRYTALIVGMRAVYEAQLRAFMSGRLR